MCRLLAVFWDHQEVINHQNGYHGTHFKETRGTTQGRLISPTLFYLIVNNVVRNWLSLTVEDKLVAHEVLVLVVGRCLGLLYSDDSVVGLQDLEWLNVALNVLIGLFRRY